MHIIVTQHLSPTYKKLLSRVTEIPVIEAKNGNVIKEKIIYITPENTDIYVKDAKIYLKSLEQSIGPKPSVNYFFNSLAKDFGNRAIGVILSGTGSDGAYGIKTIKSEGGITISQTSKTAKYDGMPNSEIETGKVDLVVPIEKLGSEVENIISKLDLTISSKNDETSLQYLYRVLFENYGVDFSLYKDTTVFRRIERRITALRIDSLSQYIKYIEEDNSEIKNLYNDILIGVTSFFRDKEAFDLLKTQIKYIVQDKNPGEEIRFWSIGCSSGEEAYSLAIVLSEVLKENIGEYKIKIFATDIDDEALASARAGIYSDTSLYSVDKLIIQKYFSIRKNNYEVKKKLREMVVFSRHNVISDSPFLRLDLITCRNMLIYFSQPLQDKFFPIVHYALNDKGVLFLGKSESVGSHINLFSVINKNAKIFKAQFTGVKEAPKLYGHLPSFKIDGVESPRKYRNSEELFEDRILDAIGAASFDKCLVINSSNDIVYTRGKLSFLSYPDGKITNNIFKLIDQDLAMDLRGAINEVSKTSQIVKTPFRAVQVYDDVVVVKYIRSVISPFLDDRNDDRFNIIFFDIEDVKDIRNTAGLVTDDSDDNKLTRMSTELTNTKVHLQSVIEELETSYEKLQSSNEELQSTNEELQTAYSELKILYEDKEEKTKQLEVLMEKINSNTEDLRREKELEEAILETTPIAVTVVDTQGDITYANTRAEKLLCLSKKPQMHLCMIR